MIDSISCSLINSLVYENLCISGFCPGEPLYIGVSGGADSICLLTSVAEGIDEKLADSTECQEINVITVDHKIRSPGESGGDCKFVMDYCSELNERLLRVKIKCKVEELKKGQVLNVESQRKKGIEEAARFLRYQIFEQNSLDCLSRTGKENIYFALAHNQNDQLETLIMRFLNGSGANSRIGIRDSRIVKCKSGKIIYVRPLLNISRSQIEYYLKERNVKWRTDSTNSDNNYLRNRIRNSIIPVLNKNVPGWQTAVLTGREKAVYENSFIEKSVEQYSWNCSGEDLFISLQVFENLEFVQKQRLLHKAFELLKVSERVPFSFVRQIGEKKYNFSKNGIVAVTDENYLWIKKQKKSVTICGFFDIIESEGLYIFDFGKLKVKNVFDSFCDLEFETNLGQKHFLSKVSLPFVFRSRQSGDTVFTKSKSKKSVSDVLSDFKVSICHKNLVPVIQSLKDENNIVAIWGELFGYSNWIV